jgi:hypothetical protein
VFEAASTVDGLAKGREAAARRESRRPPKKMKKEANFKKYIFHSFLLNCIVADAFISPFQHASNAFYTLHTH